MNKAYNNNASCQRLTIILIVSKNKN
jgi:hypothetical protein